MIKDKHSKILLGCGFGFTILVLIWLFSSSENLSTDGLQGVITRRLGLTIVFLLSLVLITYSAQIVGKMSLNFSVIQKFLFSAIGVLLLAHLLWALNYEFNFDLTKFDNISPARQLGLLAGFTGAGLLLGYAAKSIIKSKKVNEYFGPVAVIVLFLGASHAALVGPDFRVQPAIYAKTISILTSFSVLILIGATSYRIYKMKSTLLKITLAVLMVLFSLIMVWLTFEILNKEPSGGHH